MKAINWIGIVSTIWCIYGCNTSKRISNQPLIHQEVSNSIPVEIQQELVIELDSVVVDSVFEITKDTIQRELTSDEKIVEQKRNGINKTMDWAPAMHYDLRKPNYVIIHHTSQNSIAQTIRTFQVPHAKVSAHYVVGRDGRVVQMLNDYDRAWHAGKSKWGTITDINSVSIGIELDNNGREPFADMQINSLLVLLDTLKNKYLIPQHNFIGHADIAPTRKNDPSVYFPWKKLADHGYGIWYNEDYLADVPLHFNPIDALKIIGYDMSIPEAAIKAFKQKYTGKVGNGILTPQDKAILYDLYRRYY